MKQPLGRILAVIAVGIASAACGVEPDGSPEQARSWAALPKAVPMPAAAPDDPAAYRGVRFRPVVEEGSYSVESAGQKVPWLSMPPSSSEIAASPDAPHFGYQHVLDGRGRRMVWFYRLLAPPVARSQLSGPLSTPTPPKRPTPGPGQSPRDADPAAQRPAPGPGESQRDAPVKAPPLPDPAQPAQPRIAISNPERAVLDVLVLSNEPGSGRYEPGCGDLDPVIIDGDTGWLFNLTTGRIEPVDPAKFVCPED